MEMTEQTKKKVEEAFRILAANYERELATPFVEKPLAMALMRTYLQYEYNEDARVAELDNAGEGDAEWLPTQAYFGYYPNKCSRCGRTENYKELFCATCGAKMKNGKGYGRR